MNTIKFNKNVTIKIKRTWDNEEYEFLINFLEIGREYINLYRFEEMNYKGTNWTKKVLVESFDNSQYYEWHIEE